MKQISPGLWIALLFVLMGLPFLRLPGMHVDASSELACFYPCSIPYFRPSLFGYEIPVMVLPYLGAFKGWLYQPILSSLEVTALVLRLPLLLVGGASVWMFFALLDHTVGRIAAISGALLLATDASFVIATSLDFGPIAFLHFFLLAGVLLLLRFDRTQSPKYLALAFFLFGLGMWHKALFIWILAGLAAAAGAVFWKRVWTRFSPRRLGLALFFFCLGAAPLLWYNLASRGATLRTRDVMSANASFATKLFVLKTTLDGSALSGFLTEENPKPGSLRTPSGFLGKASVRLSDAIGDVKSNAMGYGFAISICLLPWLWFTPVRNAAMFAAVYMAAAWAQMAALPNTGGALHHAILLWPFPHFLMAVAGIEAGRRFERFGARALAVVLLLMIAGNVLLLNQYLARLETSGPAAVFTDAIYPLSEYLRNMGPRRFFAVDWGYSDTLCLLSDGEMDVQDISFALHSKADPEDLRSQVTKPGNVFIGRTQADERFPGVHARLTAMAEEMGYTRQVLQVIEDRNHRPRFEVIRYVKKAAASD